MTHPNLLNFQNMLHNFTSGEKNPHAHELLCSVCFSVLSMRVYLPILSHLI